MRYWLPSWRWISFHATCFGGRRVPMLVMLPHSGERREWMCCATLCFRDRQHVTRIVVAIITLMGIILSMIDCFCSGDSNHHHRHLPPITIIAITIMIIIIILIISIISIKAPPLTASSTFPHLHYTKQRICREALASGTISGFPHEAQRLFALMPLGHAGTACSKDGLDMLEGARETETLRKATLPAPPHPLTYFTGKWSSIV